MEEEKKEEEKQETSVICLLVSAEGEQEKFIATATHPGQPLVFLPVCVLQPLHELGVAQQVPVQWTMFGQAQLGGVLRQRGALVVALSNTARGGSFQTTFTSHPSSLTSSTSKILKHVVIFVLRPTFEKKKNSRKEGLKIVFKYEINLQKLKYNSLNEIYN